MSLLLDALKKAAQQKAQKSRSETPSGRSSDETLLDIAAEDVARRAASDDSSTQLTDDETEFDQSELGVRLDRIGRERGAADDTGLILSEPTDTRSGHSQSGRSADEETGLDVPDATRTNIQQDVPSRGVGDETSLTVPDATRTNIQQDVPSHEVGDETRLDAPDVTSTTIQQDVASHEMGDETRLDAPDATSTTIQQDVPSHEVGDETRLDAPDATRTNIQQEVPSHEVGDETRLGAPDATRTNIQQDVPSHEVGDETRLDAPDATRTNIQQDVPSHGVGDETSLDMPDATRMSIQQDVPSQDVSDETSLDMPDATRTNVQPDLQKQAQDEETRLELSKTEFVEPSGEDDPGGQTLTDDDETIVFVAQDAEDLEIKSGPVARVRSAVEDETNLNQLPAEEGQAEDHQQPVDSAAAENDPDFSQPQQSGDKKDDDVTADDSDLASHSQSQQDEAGVETVSDDGTDSDATDFKQPPVRADQIEHAQPQRPAEDDLEDAGDSAADHDVMDDEDLSLMLIEREETKPELPASTSFTEPQNPQPQKLAIEDFAPGMEELSMADKTQIKAPEDQTVTRAPTLTNPATAALIADKTRTNINSPTVTRTDSTSTRTYAPDNYDRTLMKVANDDAADIFSGMKSDSDVVMTPDYAKKVFRSKTSTQRVRHLWVYAGIMCVLVLSVIFFGLVGYMDQSEQIDNSLRALKRDPMPGIIKQVEPEKTDLFTEPDPVVKARTVEIIESANLTGSATVVEDTISQAEIEDTVSPAEIVESTTAPQVATAQVEPTPSVSRAEPVQAKQPPVERNDSDLIVSSSSAPSSDQTVAKSNLHFTSNSQYQKTDIWLREAYAAYLVGDNQLALSLYNKVLEVDPANRNALLARAAINMQNGDIDAAIRDYQRLLLANPKDSLAMSSLLAVSTYSPQETESQLKLMLHEEPDSPYLNFALANSYGAQNRWQEAQRHYFKALQNNPNDPNYAYNLAVSLEHISQPRSAITYYQLALDNFTSGLATFNSDVVNQRLELLGKL